MEQIIIDKINSIVKNKARISINEPMKAHTVFRIGGNADVYISIANEEELVSLISLFKEENVPYFLIGNGSNLLVSDDGFRGVVLEIGKDYAGISCEYKEIVALAGTMLSKVSHVACDNSLTGLEFASGIPGTVGGAVIMNAGAYGGEIKQVASKVKVLLPNGEIKWLSNEEMEFEYRNSKAKKEGYIILEASFSLFRGEKEIIEGIMKELSNKRREKQPLEYPSAGSTFKRPEGHFAGKLISDSGLKGYSVGDAQVSEKHAGFVINKGEATAKDVYTLINDVRNKVYEDSGVMLEPEVVFVGDFE